MTAPLEVSCSRAGGSLGGTVASRLPPAREHGSVRASADTTDTPERARLLKAGQRFEAVFLRQMIGAMRQAGLGDALLGGEATEQFRDMSDARLADTMAGKGTLGIADLLVRQYGARLAAPAAKDGTAE